MSSLRSLAAALLATACIAVAQGPAPPSASDADVIAAKALFDRGDARQLDQLAPRLAGHPLEIYVDYWRLWLRLPNAADDDVRAFMARAAGTPLVDIVRVEWLKGLARRGQWSTFAAEYAPPVPGEDTELACDGVQLRRQRDGDAALAAAKPLWFTGQSTPDACEPLFAAMIARGDLTLADRHARLRLASEAGNTRLVHAIAIDLPPDDRISAREFAFVDRDPVRALAKGEFNARKPGGRELALYALERASRTDAAGARAAWEKLRPRLPDADRLYGNGRLAYHAARQLVTQANDWYREAAGATLTDAQQAWRARAALRAGAWSDVADAIDAMPPALALEPAWRYWKARAYAATARGDDAKLLYAGLAEEPTFYGLLAAEALGREPPSYASPPAPTSEALASFGARPDVARAVKLAELGLRAEAVREWLPIVRGRSDGELLVAAEYARRRGLYDRAINTADRTTSSHDFALRYLTPYREQFIAAAREQALDPALLFGIARQESRFSADIVSSAGAVGLMQLMPPTAKWVAKQIGDGAFTASRISDPALNTQYGAFYFRYVLDKLDGSAPLAAAAYNAGPNRAQAWRVGAPLEGAVWVETIPFNETRDYVKKVLANTVYYARELHQPHVPLTSMLGTISARGAANGEAARGGPASPANGRSVAAGG